MPMLACVLTAPLRPPRPLPDDPDGATSGQWVRAALLAGPDGMQPALVVRHRGPLCGWSIVASGS
jgi:hypothetical protein